MKEMILMGEPTPTKDRHLCLTVFLFTTYENGWHCKRWERMYIVDREWNKIIIIIYKLCEMDQWRFLARRTQNCALYLTKVNKQKNFITHCRLEMKLHNSAYCSQCLIDQEIPLSQKPKSICCLLQWHTKKALKEEKCSQTTGISVFHFFFGTAFAYNCRLKLDSHEMGLIAAQSSHSRHMFFYYESFFHWRDTSPFRWRYIT